MSIAALFNVPEDQRTLNTWGFAHMANHRDIIRALNTDYGTNLSEFILDPVDFENSGDWERQHQVMHHEMNAVVGLSGFDLLGLDWKNENRRAAWVLLNATEHRTISDFLRLG